MNARIRELIAAAPSEQRRYPLRFAFQNYAGPVVSGIALGFLGADALDIGLGRIAPNSMMLVIMGIGVALGIVVRVLLVSQRQGDVTIEIDERGIRELGGGIERISIAWEQARASIRKFRTRARFAAAVDHVDVRFAGPDGEQIVLTDLDRGGFFPWSRFRVVSRHLLRLELAIAEHLPTLPEKTPDPREKRFGAWYGTLFGVLATLWCYGWLFFFCQRFGNVHDDPFFPSFGLGARAAFSGLLGLGPLVHLMRELGRLGRAPDISKKRLRGFVRVRLVVLVLALAFPWLAGWRLSARCHELNPEMYVGRGGYSCYD